MGPRLVPDIRNLDPYEDSTKARQKCQTTDLDCQMPVSFSHKHLVLRSSRLCQLLLLANLAKIIHESEATIALFYNLWTRLTNYLPGHAQTSRSPTRYTIQRSVMTIISEPVTELATFAATHGVKYFLVRLECAS